MDKLTAIVQHQIRLPDCQYPEQFQPLRTSQIIFWAQPKAWPPCLPYKLTHSNKVKDSSHSMKMAPGILAAHLQCILSGDVSTKGETLPQHQPLHVYLQHPAHTPESSCRYASALALLQTFQPGLQTACNKTLSNLPVSSDIPT